MEQAQSFTFHPPHSDSILGCDLILFAAFYTLPGGSCGGRHKMIFERYAFRRGDIGIKYSRFNLRQLKCGPCSLEIVASVL